MQTLRLVSTMLLTLAASASAATYVVDQKAGNDNSPGSAAAPFKTLAKALAALKPGDTLTINAGVYREQVAVKALGTEKAPLLIQAAPGQRVVISGADPITTWKPATQEQTNGNPNAKNIITADIDWIPTTIFEDGKEQELARTPNEGWWPTVKADANSVTDPVHLNQKSDVWSGATVFFFRYKGVTQHHLPVKSFNPATNTLTLAEPLPGTAKTIYTPGSDRYRIENKVTLIDRPGEWCFENVRTADQPKTRLFYWPNNPSATIEIPRRPHALDLGETAFCTVDGLEIAHTIYPGRTPDAAIGNDVNTSIPTAGENITVQRCTIHHNGRFAFFGRNYKNLKLLNNLIYRNQYGVGISNQTGALVEGNEIAENLVDGLIISASSDIVVRKNFVHHHCLLMHPDNIQLHSDAKNITFDSNFVLASGQSFMIEAAQNITFTNNLVVGSEANMIIMGHGNATKGKWERNTFALWTSSLFNFTAQDYQLKQNIMSNHGGAMFYRIPDKGAFESDQNLWYIAAGSSKRIAGKGERGAVTWFDSIADLQKAGYEKNSVLKDPKFKNAPLFCVDLDNKHIGDCTRDKLILAQSDAQLFKTGDIVEIHFDGVVRKVKAVDGTTLTIDPPLSAAPDRGLFVANWKTNKNFTLDFASPTNNQFGSTINAPAYIKGDFDNDGKRDIPESR